MKPHWPLSMSGTCLLCVCVCGVCGVCDLLLFDRSPYWFERFFKSNLTLLYVIKCKCNN